MVACALGSLVAGWRRPEKARLGMPGIPALKPNVISTLLFAPFQLGVIFIPGGFSPFSYFIYYNPCMINHLVMKKLLDKIFLSGKKNKVYRSLTMLTFGAPKILIWCICKTKKFRVDFTVCP